LLFASVEGRTPFRRETALATLGAAVDDALPAPGRAGPLRPVIEGLLRKHPDDRLSAAEAERLLRRVAGGSRSRGGGAAAVPGAREGRRGGGGRDGSGGPAERRSGRGREASGAGRGPRSGGRKAPVLVAVAALLVLLAAGAGYLLGG
ncbi:serine/threonine protein kinase, partial [Streptomyces sp. CAI-78]|nr:serine/threonine protein kinase [Streptomyces sp. CAI-78]